MNKRWVGFIAAVFFYVVGVVILIALILFLREQDWGHNIPDEMLPPILVGTPFLPPLMAGIGLLIAQKWRALQGWLMGFAFVVFFLMALVAWLYFFR